MKSVKVHGNTKLGKRLRKSKASKWAEDAQGKTKGTQEPISKKVQSIGERIHGRPKKGPVGSSHYSGNDRVIWQVIMVIKK